MCLALQVSRDAVLPAGRPWSVFAWCLLLLGTYQLAGAGTIKAKAWLAPILIEQAWQQTQATDEKHVKPWPWADTWPVARLSAPAYAVDLLVLAGDSGNALAFGPGHATASAPLGSAGLAVVGGHRDTHFAFLQELQAGSQLTLELADGSAREYRVTSISIVDSERESVSASDTQDTLLLVTCYPFEALFAGGALRYVVAAKPIKA